jgi:hypothetical protein
LFCYCQFSIFIFIPIIFFLPIQSTLPSLSSYSYTHPLQSPSFSCAKFNCFPPQQLDLHLLTHSLPPALTLLSHSTSTCHQTTPPSYTLITHWTPYYTLHSSKPLHSLTQAPPTTTTEIYTNTRITKTSSSHTDSTTDPCHFSLPFQFHPI